MSVRVLSGSRERIAEKAPNGTNAFASFHKISEPPRIGPALHTSLQHFESLDMTEKDQDDSNGEDEMSSKRPLGRNAACHQCRLVFQTSL